MRRRPPFLPSLVFLLILAFVVERLIVTDEEALEQWAEDTSEAASAADLEALRGLMAPELTFEQRDLDETLAYLGRQFRKFTPRNIQVELRAIEVSGDTARSDARVHCNVAGRPLRIGATLHFVRLDGDWRLARVENAHQASLAR